MRRLARLLDDLDTADDGDAAVGAIARYLAEVPVADAACAVHLLAGGGPRRIVSGAVLRAAAGRAAALPAWLVDASVEAVGDVAETLALVLPEAAAPRAIGLAQWVHVHLQPLRTAPRHAQVDAVVAALAGLDAPARFVACRLLGSGLRVAGGRRLVQRALARHAGIAPALVAERMDGGGRAESPPDAARFLALIAPAAEGASGRSGQPYPWRHARPLPADVGDLGELLGDIGHWHVEWRLDGVRAQLVRRDGGAWLWSRDDELLGQRCPDLVAAAQALPPDTVLEGTLLAWRAGAPRPLSWPHAQRHLARSTPRRPAGPAATLLFVAWDLLEHAGAHCGALPLRERVARLDALGLPEAGTPGALLCRAARLAPAGWAECAALRARAREMGCTGLMLKHRDDDMWWSWAVEPLTVDAVLLYAAPGSHADGRGTTTAECTFALWNRAPRDAAEAQAVVDAIRRGEPPPAERDALRLLPLARTAAGLGASELAAVERELRSHTLARHGPVHGLRPTQVFELAFDAVVPNARRASGIELRAPRVRRIRPDAPRHEAGTLPMLVRWLPAMDPCPVGPTAGTAARTGHRAHNRRSLPPPRSPRGDTPVMDIPSFQAFEAQARAAGCDEVIERSWPPDQVLDEHTHDFDVQALVVRGEMWLTLAGTTRHLKPGDRFELARATPHAERYGADGATYWAARRRG